MSDLKNDDFVLNLCDRLRKLRKRLDLNIEDVSILSGLTSNQIQRFESEIRNKKLVKQGAYGTAATTLVLLNFYAQKVSLDILFDLNVPVADIPLNKVAVKEVSRTKILALIDDLKNIADYL